LVVRPTQVTERRGVAFFCPVHLNRQASRKEDEKKKKRDGRNRVRKSEC